LHCETTAAEVHIVLKRQRTQRVSTNFLGQPWRQLTTEMLGNFLRGVSSRRRRRQRFAVAPERIDPLVHDSTKFGVHLRFIVAVAAGSDDSRTLADKALIFVRPLDDFYVSSAFVHDRDSSMAFLTARS
jgi:hypothetical protein